MKYRVEIFEDGKPVISFEDKDEITFEKHLNDKIDEMTKDLNRKGYFCPEYANVLSSGEHYAVFVNTDEKKSIYCSYMVTNPIEKQDANGVEIKVGDMLLPLWASAFKEQIDRYKIRDIFARVAIDTQDVEHICIKIGKCEFELDDIPFDQFVICNP